MAHATPAVILLILVFTLPVLYYIRRAAKGREIYIRRIAGIDAIDDAIGRTIELGRPMSFTSGLTGISPVLYASLGVLRYIGRKAAVFKSRVFVPCSDPEALALTDATLQNAYRTEKRFANYNPSMIRFLSEEQFAFASGYQGLMHREQVGSAFLFGRFAAESLILAEAGQQVGAIQVAATINAEQIPFFLTACDYTLIGEELYVAGAYLSKDPVQSGSLRGQDVVKCFVAVLLLLGIAQATYNAVSAGEGEKPAPPAVVGWLQASWSEVFGGE